MPASDLSASSADPPARRYSVPAVEKAFAIVDMLAGASDGSTLQEISGQLGRSKGELYRVLAALQANDLVRRDPATDRHFLTSRLLEIAHRHPPTDHLLRTSQPVMSKLALMVEQSCHLAVLHRLNVLIVTNVLSPLPMQYSVRVGSQFSALEASSGIVILAHSSAATKARVMAGQGAVARNSYERRFASVVATGRERFASAVVPGVTNLSAPIFARSGRVAAALTVPFLPQHDSHSRLDECEEALIGAARAIGASLAAEEAMAHR